MTFWNLLTQLKSHLSDLNKERAQKKSIDYFNNHDKSFYISETSLNEKRF
jgi:hypothetical protein